MAFPAVASQEHLIAREDARRLAMTLYRRLFCPLSQSLFLSTVDMLTWWPDMILAAGNGNIALSFQ
jgi:hypothetical protein